MAIETINGEIKAQQLGITYCHEHLCIDLSSQKQDEDANFDQTEEIIKELQWLKHKGVSSLVELTNRGMGRKITVLRQIAQQSGIQVIVSTGFYKEPFLPDYVYTTDEKGLTKLLVEDIECGIEETKVRAHVIGEIGTSYNQVTATEEKVLRACAGAQVETGRPLSTHTTLGTMAIWQIQYLKKLGVDLTKLIIGHLDLNPEPEYLRNIASYGCYLGFDTIGKVNYQPDEKRIAAIQDLINHGHGKQILLSQDLTRKSHLKENGGIGYSYLMDDFVPRLLAAGISRQQLSQMLIDNPKTILDV